MRFPQEIVTNTVIPAVRFLMSRELADAGLNQHEIADLLGVSQSAVSKYAAGRFTPDPRIAGNDRLQATVEDVAAGLADGTLTKVQALGELMALVRAFETRGPICTLHEDQMPELDGLGCDLCIDPGASRVLQEQEVLADVQRAVRRLTATPGFARLVPHVGSNVAVARPDARDLTDVAAVAGGLVDLHGEVRAPGQAGFGVSRHVAEVALAVARVDPRRRAVANVRLDDAVLEAARASGWTTREVEANLERDQARLAEVLEDADGVPDLLYHRGAFGVEPIAYVTAPDAAEAARRVLDLLRHLETDA